MFKTGDDSTPYLRQDTIPQRRTWEIWDNEKTWKTDIRSFFHPLHIISWTTTTGRLDFKIETNEEVFEPGQKESKSDYQSEATDSAFRKIGIVRKILRSSDRSWLMCRLTYKDYLQVPMQVPKHKWAPSLPRKKSKNTKL